MRLNGIYIPHVKKWNFKASGAHKRTVTENYIYPKDDEAGSVHGSQLSFKVYNRQASKELEEMFDNTEYTLPVKEDFYIEVKE